MGNWNLWNNAQMGLWSSALKPTKDNKETFSFIYFSAENPKKKTTTCRLNSTSEPQTNTSGLIYQVYVQTLSCINLHESGGTIKLFSVKSNLERALKSTRTYCGASQSHWPHSGSPELSVAIETILFFVTFFCWPPFCRSRAGIQHTYLSSKPSGAQRCEGGCEGTESGKRCWKGEVFNWLKCTRGHECNSRCEGTVERNERNVGLEERLEKFQVEFLNFQLRVIFSKLKTNLWMWVDHFIKWWNFQQMQHLVSKIIWPHFRTHYYVNYR